jgi:hypothetical protein
MYRGKPAVQSGLSSRGGPPVAEPLRGIRQHEQIQTGEKLQGEHEYCQEAQPSRILFLGYGDAVNDDDHCEGNGQPTVDLAKPLVPVQWDLLHQVSEIMTRRLNPKVDGFLRKAKNRNKNL